MSIFDRVINFKTLMPITSDPEDWEDRSEMSGEPFWQSKRDPSYFSKDGGKTWWCLDGEPPRERTNPESEGYYWALPPQDQRFIDGGFIVEVDKAHDGFRIYAPGDDGPMETPVDGWRFFGPLKAHEFSEVEGDGDE